MYKQVKRMSRKIFRRTLLEVFNLWTARVTAGTELPH
jgi:hypothetical protein